MKMPRIPSGKIQQTTLAGWLSFSNGFLKMFGDVTPGAWWADIGKLTFASWFEIIVSFVIFLWMVLHNEDDKARVVVVKRKV